VQAGDGQAERLDGGPDSRRFLCGDPVGRFAQRERGDFQPLITQICGDLALAFERHPGEHFIA
jgi:hypothetical protein